MVNDFIFHIVYRTKDTVRSEQTRPDLRKYLLASKYDKVPQHNQFNNQQDIVVDSVKFGNNVYGKLIRTGNTTYEITEWVTSLFSLKEVGDLYLINGEWFYVATVENVYYTDHIVSKVQFSKDYNQLSEVIGIPSEPRFYEISEQSLINRENARNSYIVLGTTIKSTQNSSSYIQGKGWDYIARVIVGNETDFPKYAITVFKNDKDRLYGSVIGNEDFYVDVCHPISTYSIQNTLTMEWDMVDNFSAGDRVTQYKNDPETIIDFDSAYNPLHPVRYVDAFGRSDLIDFIIMEDFGTNGLSDEQIFNLPESPVRTQYPNMTFVGELNQTTLPTTEELNAFVNRQLSRTPQANDVILVEYTETTTETSTVTYYVYEYNGTEWNSAVTNSPNTFTNPSINDYAEQYLFGNEPLADLGDHYHGLALVKDNREQISLNYNIQMLTDSDRFVLSAYLWQPAKTQLKIALLSQEVSKIVNETIDSTTILSGQTYDFTYTVDETNGTITINIQNALASITNKEWNSLGVGAIAIISEDTSALNGANYFVMARNVSDLNRTEATKNWYISNVDTNMFKRQ